MSRKPQSIALGQLTRAVNEVTYLISIETPPNDIKGQYTQMCKKFHHFRKTVENILKDAEGEEKSNLNEWFEKNIAKFEKQRAEIDDYMGDILVEFETQEEYQDKDDDKTSISSKRSNVSNVSIDALKTKLIEERSLCFSKQIAIDIEKQIEQEKQKMTSILEDLQKSREKAKLALIDKQIRHLELTGELLTDEDVRDAAQLIQDENTKNISTPIKKETDQKFNIASTTEASNSSYENQNSNLSSIEKLIKNQMMAASLPKISPVYFDGSDITLFKTFLLEFNRITDRGKFDDNIKYEFLLEYTKGLAHDIVLGHNSDNAAISFQNAMHALKQRYDNPYAVAQAHISKLKKFPVIDSRDKHSLDKFSILLRQTYNMTKDISAINQLNLPEQLMQLVNILPFKFKQEFHNKAFDIHKNNGEVKFIDLVEFTEHVSERSNFAIFNEYDTMHPVVNKSYKSRSTMSKNLFTNSAPSNSNAIPRALKQCLLCKQNHELYHCDNFKAMTINERLEFVNKNNVCKRCLKKSNKHTERNCYNSYMCAYCRGKHSSFLCFKKYPMYNNQRNNNGTQRGYSSVSQDRASAVASGNARNQANSAQSLASINNDLNTNVKYLHSIVPITVTYNGKSINIYASFDTCSSMSFISLKLAQLFSDKSNRDTCNINLTTLTEKNSAKEFEVLRNFQIKSMDNNFQISLPYILIAENWPYTECDAPVKDELNSFEHLKDVPFNFIKNGRVEMLIGMELGYLFKHDQIVAGGIDEPFAAHSPTLGWILNGAIKLSNANYFNSLGHCLVSKINKRAIKNVADLDNKIDFLFSRDFVDINDDDTQLSNDEKAFLNIVENGIKVVTDKNGKEKYEIPLPFINNIPVFNSNNKNIALNFFYTIRKKLRKNERDFKEYKDFIHMMLDRGFAEKVSQPDQVDECNKYYIAHFLSEVRMRAKTMRFALSFIAL